MIGTIVDWHLTRPAFVARLQRILQTRTLDASDHGCRSDRYVAGRTTTWIATRFLCLQLLTIVAAAEVCLADVLDRSPRVLLLYPYDERIPATNIAGESARTRLLEATAGKIDLFSEFLDLSRFPEKDHVDRMARYLAEKYIDHRPDVVIAIGEEATRFIVANRTTVTRDARIVFCGFSGAAAEQMDLPDDVFGV